MLAKRRDWIINCTFIDEQGCRWIVEYKTSSHEGSDVEAFLDREKIRYAAQLERYAQLMGGEAPLRLGLHFPLLNGWRESVAAGGE